MVESLLLPADRLPCVSRAQIDAAVRGELRLRWSTSGRAQALVSALQPVDRVVFEHAKRVGYVVLRRPRSSLERAWLLWCDAANQPFIRVELVGRAHAVIDLELLPGRGTFSERAAVRLRWLVREVGGKFEWLDQHICRVVGVPQRQLETVADAMRTIAVGDNQSPDGNGVLARA
jgi:hypothetical protein